MPHSFLSYGFLLSFLGSIVALRWWQEPLYPTALWIVLGSVALGAVFLCIPKPLRGIGCMGLASACGIALAILTVARTTHVPDSTTIDTYATKQSIVLHGFIVDDPDRRPLRTHYTVETAHIRLDGEEIPVHGRVLLSHLFGWPEFSYGDEIVASGTLEKPKPFDDFAYDRYLSRVSIYSVMPRAEIEKNFRRERASLPRNSVRSEAPLRAPDQKLIPEPHTSLLAGLLTGSRRGLPKALLLDFNRTGLSHIIAISGQNITIVITCIGLLLFFVPLRYRIVPLLLAVVSLCSDRGSGRIRHPRRRYGAPRRVRAGERTHPRDAAPHSLDALFHAGVESQIPLV